MEKKYITPEFISAQDIRNLRKNCRMTQKEFAEFVGVSKPTVERWESNDGNISGAISLVVMLLNMHPEYMEELVLPQNEYPLRLWYYHENKLCTIIDVDEARRKVLIKNYTENLIFRAFGKIEKPSYEEYEEFLESRCFPKERDKMKIMLKELDLPFYDPFLIIEKTEGRMAEDHFHIRIEKRGRNDRIV